MLLNSVEAPDFGLMAAVADYLRHIPYNRDYEDETFGSDVFERMREARSNRAAARELEREWRKRPQFFGLMTSLDLIHLAHDAIPTEKFYDLNFDDIDLYYGGGYGVHYFAERPDELLRDIYRDLRALQRDLKKVKLWPVTREDDEEEEGSVIYSSTILGSPAMLKKMAEYQKRARAKSKESSSPPDSESSGPADG